MLNQLIVCLCAPPPPNAEDPDEREADPAIVAYLNSSHWPNEFNCSERKSIRLSMTQGQELDHRPYTFFLSPL